MKTPYVILLVIGVAGLFVAVGWLAWSLIRPYGSIKTWPEIATRLGLTHTPFPVSTAMHPGSMAGTYEGYEVSISAQERYRRGALMVIEVRFHEPLGLGLSLGTSGAVRPPAAGGLAEFSTPDQRFDKAFGPCARDTISARGVFAQDPVRGRLLDLAGRGGNVGVDDNKLVYSAEQLVTDFAPMKELLDQAVQVTRSIEDARR